MLEVLQVMDAQALVGVSNLTHVLGLTTALQWLSRAGDNGECWIALGIILLFFRRTRCMGVAILLALVLSSLISLGVLKTLVERPRPCTIWLPAFLSYCPPSFSFPSGHTTAAFATVGVVWMMRSSLLWPVLIAALLMGLSRMALFVHYPTDVMAGLIVGLGSGFIVASLVRWNERRHMNDL